MKKTKTLQNYLLTTAIGLSLLACGSKNSAEKTEIKDVASAEMATVPKNKAQQIISAYLALKDALVQTDGATASALAKELLVSLQDSSDELINKIKADAEQISATAETEQQRVVFSSMSDNVYTLAKTTKASNEPLYLQYCPMALDNTGASWLSSEKEVLNPYFGDKMLKCGKVKEEL